MFGFNRKKHGRANLRVKCEEEEDIAAASGSAAPAKHKKSKSKKSDRNTDEKSKESGPKLSFDDELKADADFKVKKSSVSRKLAREREREKSKKIKAEKVYNDVEDDFVVMDDVDGEPTSDMDSEQIEEDITYNTSTPDAVSKPSAIPDAYAIHKARKKREQARRQQESSADYIAVRNKRAPQDAVYKRDNTRFIREEDEDEEERVEMRVHTEELESEEIHMEGEGDEECIRWEEEQIRKGSSISTGTDISLLSHPRVETPKQTGLQVDDYIPKFVMPEISIDAISNELCGELNSVKSLVSENERELESTERALENSTQNISKLELQVADLSSAFEFYQETKCYITDYSKLLSLKIEALEAVEGDIYSLFSQRTIENREIRRTQQQRLSVKVGAIKGEEGSYNRGPIETPSSCPTSDEEVEQDFVKNYNEIVDRSEGVMADVRSDYGELTLVKRQFEKWKLQQGESYRNAYITHCLPLVFSPLIRLEMLGWNPIQPSCPNFEEYSWFLSLMTYGSLEGQDPREDDPDTNLIPIIVNKVLLPKISKLIETCWDPFSTQQTIRLVQLLTQIFEDYITKDKKSAEKDKLIKCIQNQVEQLIIHEAFLPFTVERSNKPDSKVERFLSFQYIKCIKILQNILLWEGVLTSGLVNKLAVDSLLNRHLIAFLQTSPNLLDTVDKIDMIIKTLPVAWFERTDKLLPQLNSFATFLASLVQTLERKQTQCATETDKKLHKTGIRRVMSMILRINAMDMVRKSR